MAIGPMNEIIKLPFCLPCTDSNLMNDEHFYVTIGEQLKEEAQQDRLVI